MKRGNSNEKQTELIKSHIQNVFKALDYEGNHLVDPALFFKILRHFKVQVSALDKAKISSLCSTINSLNWIQALNLLALVPKPKEIQLFEKVNATDSNRNLNMKSPTPTKSPKIQIPSNIMENNKGIIKTPKREHALKTQKITFEKSFDNARDLSVLKQNISPLAKTLILRMNDANIDPTLLTKILFALTRIGKYKKSIFHTQII